MTATPCHQQILIHCEKLLWQPVHLAHVPGRTLLQAAHLGILWKGGENFNTIIPLGAFNRDLLLFLPTQNLSDIIQHSKKG
jgi:hypothetical protein